MLCTGDTFVRENPYLVAGIVLFDTVDLHLLTLHILEPLSVTLSLINGIFIVPFKILLESMLLNLPAAKIW